MTETPPAHIPVAQTRAEERILAEVAQSGRIMLGDGSRPSASTPEVEVRAAFLRDLLQSGGPLGAGKGLRLRGAWVSGALDLQGADIGVDVSLSHCHLAEAVTLVNTRLRGLYLTGCHIAGLAADHARFDGSLYLRDGTHVAGEISLAGAVIVGDVQCCGVEIACPGADAIFAPQLEVTGSMFLGNYPYSDGETTLTCNGMLFLSSLRVAHDVFVSHSAIAPKDDPLTGSIFGATEEHGRSIALSLARAQVGGLLYFQANQINRGIVNLAGATVARLTDEPEGPGAAYPIRLDGFRYTDFSRHTNTSLSARLKWVERRPEGTPFTAQPYEQLADVLGRMGHRLDAQAVLMRKERRLREEDRALMRNPARKGVAWFADGVLRLAIGYGYRPARALVVTVVLIAALGLFFDATWRAGDMTPNAAPILVSAEWVRATQVSETPGAYWSQPGRAGQDWETFNAFAYAADLLIPIVDLGQESAWAPSTSRSPLGQAAWWIRWFAKALGWVITALAAAAVTGVIRRE